MVCGHRRAICGLDHRHRGCSAQQLDKHAAMLRVEMLDQHESHPAIRGHVGEEGPKRLQAASRGPDADDQAPFVLLGSSGCSVRFRICALVTRRPVSDAYSRRRVWDQVFFAS